MRCHNGGFIAKPRPHINPTALLLTPVAHESVEMIYERGKLLTYNMLLITYLYVRTLFLNLANDCALVYFYFGIKSKDEGKLLVYKNWQPFYLVVLIFSV